jgi:dTDP-4-dehydrorhamnose reductase
MKILITGSNGLLAQKIIFLALKESVNILATSKGVDRSSNFHQINYEYLSLDITNKDQVSSIINKFKPDVVFNTAAMTNVDLCEEMRHECDEINITAVGFLADACLEVNAHLIHFSTDFIFDGENSPYSEGDPPNPLSYYGLAKLKSEELLDYHEVKSSVLRTIILFGVGNNLSKNNIVLWAKEALESGKELNIIDDHYRAPTLAEDLAAASLFAAKEKVYGVFNVSGKDIMSIFELVVSVAEYFNLNSTLIARIHSSKLKQLAKRPIKTGFVLDKAEKELNYHPHSFIESLEIIKNQLKNN